MFVILIACPWAGFSSPALLLATSGPPSTENLILCLMRLLRGEDEPIKENSKEGETGLSKKLKGAY